MTSTSVYSRFTSELVVRPDDIDMNNHVHNSKYFDYVLAARYDQMERCYKMSMEEFVALGFTWVVVSCYIEYKRPLRLGDTIVVTTGIEDVRATGVKVQFSIHKKGTGKLSAEGYFDYALLNKETGKPERIPKIVIDKYTV